VIGRHVVIFVIAALFLSMATDLAAETPGPVAIVNAIYKGGSNTGMAFGLDPVERHKYFSKTAAGLWDLADAKTSLNGDEVGALDFDITTNSQGAEVKSYSVVSNKIDGASATVVVKLVLENWIRHSPDDDIIRYSFVLENDRWMIDDVGGAADGKLWTLRGLLEINSHDRVRSKE
jgi:hypothetical protein